MPSQKQDIQVECCCNGAVGHDMVVQRHQSSKFVTLSTISTINITSQSVLERRQIAYGSIFHQEMLSVWLVGPPS